MGNAVPRMCDDASTVDGTRARSVGAARRPGGKVVPRMCDDATRARSVVGAARRRGGKVVPRMCDDVSAVDGTRARSIDGAARRRSGKIVPQRGGVEQEQAGGGGSGGGPVCATVKVVLTRKEAERLITRLQEDNSARERHARIAELTGQLRAGDGAGGRMQEAWKPRLRTIQEN